MRLLSGCRPFTTTLAVFCFAVMASRLEAQPSENVGGEPQTSPLSRMIGSGLLPELRGGGLLSAAVQALESGQGAAQPAKARDSVLNGVLIGAGIGALVGLIPDYYDDCEECHDSLYASIAVGAGVGLLVDLLHNSKQAASPSQPNDALHFRAAIGRRAIGLGGTLRW
jgi:hypothetical protein